MYVLIGIALLSKGKFDLQDLTPIGSMKPELLDTLAIVFASLGGIMIVFAAFSATLFAKKYAAAQDNATVISIYMVNKIVQNALVEALGIYGLVLLLLSGDIAFIAFMGVAVFFHIIFFPYPKDEEFFKRLQEKYSE